MASTGEKRPGKRKKGGLNAFVELVVIVAVALLLALGIQRFLVKPFRIPSESMVPTLAVGQRVLVDRLSYRWGEPSRGDVVVFNPPAGADEHVCGVPKPADEPCPQGTSTRSPNNFIKRVVGLPGDHLKVIDNRVYINGRLQKEPWIQKGTPCDPEFCTLAREITIPKGEFFMMGDNRGQSDDSRDWGPVPKKWLIGRAFFTYWPPGRLGTL